MGATQSRAYRCISTTSRHGVEQHRQRPVKFLAAAGKDDVLLADLDGLVGVADAMVRGGAGRRDRIVHALDLEPGGKRGGRRRRHRLRHRERADPLRSLAAGGIGGLDQRARRGPPEPMMMPVRTLETSLGSRPESRIACSIAMWFQAAPSPRKRIARRSITSAGLSVGAPCTWERKPSSAYFSARVIPDFAAWRLASTSGCCFRWTRRYPSP